MTTVGFFWMAFWAFCLGYLISSMIQVFVTEERMQRSLGGSGAASVALASFFGFISSSCSFAALSTSRALFQKGAALVPALAFLLASTNLVVELGILIYIFLDWQFVVAEYVGGLLLIGVMWMSVRVTLPERLERAAREHAEAAADDGDREVPDWRQLPRTLEGWRRVARRFYMEWGMVWKDVTLGFTVAGVIATFVPSEFFQTLFVGADAQGGPEGWQIVLQTLIGPVAAFFTFIGSMGNIPLAAVLFTSGVSFAGIIAFMFSDLVVFPVLRISARYFGWPMALYILGVFLFSLVTTALVLHAGFAFFDALPTAASAHAASPSPTERFALDYTFVLNVILGGLSLGLAWLAFPRSEKHHEHEESPGMMDRMLLVLARGSLLWLAGGVGLFSFFLG